MARANVHELSVRVEDAEEHGGVTLHLRVFTQEAVDVLDQTHWISADGNSRERSLEHRREQRRPEALSGNVRDQNRCATLVKRKNIKVIAADRMARRVNAAYCEVREIAQTLRNECLLNAARDVELLLQALPLALAFHQTRIV